MTRREIPLTKGAVTYVDEADYDFLSNYSWCVSSHGYAVSRIGGKLTYMHRLLLGHPEGKQVDHIDRNKLNNTRGNLRVVDPFRNQQNKSKVRRDTTSKYKGVYWHKSRRRWQVQIKCPEKRHFVGYFDCERDAALAYNEKARELFGKHAALNDVGGR